MPRTKTELLLAVLTLIVIGLHLDYLWTVRTAVPHQDEWTGLDMMFQAQDRGQVFQWLFSSRNGHFGMPAALAYLAAYHLCGLDLTPIRLLNFPILLLAFLLLAWVIHRNVSQPALRYYLYLGSALTLFNLGFWEHFAQAGAYTTIVSHVLGASGLWFVAKALAGTGNRLTAAAVGVLCLIGAILAFGSGYLAVAAAVSLLLTRMMRNGHAWRRLPAALPIVSATSVMIGIGAVLSHPYFELKTRALAILHHALIVAGSIMAAPFDNQVMALNAAYVFGCALIVLALWAGFDYVANRQGERGVLPSFALGLVFFGLFSCGAVAAARTGIIPSGEFLSSRYTIYPAVCLLGALLYCARANLFLMPHVWCLIAAGYVGATVEERAIAPHRPAVYQNIAKAVRNIDSLPDEELRSTLYWQENTAGVRRVAARLRRDQLNLFRPTAEPTPALPR